MAQTVYNIIKYDGGDNNVLVHKIEITDFKIENRLIVDQSQQVLLYKDGQAEGPFMAGQYMLPTIHDISKFRKFFAKLFGRYKPDDKVPFTCDAYFVNMVNDVSVAWGTPSRTMVKDPVYNEIVNVGANGNVKIKISDAMLFVTSVNGKMGGYTLDRIAATVRGEIMTVIKTYIAQMIIDRQVSLLEIHKELVALSEATEKKLNERLGVFGLSAVNFNVNDISVDAESQKRLLDRQNKINARSDVVLDAAATTDAEAYRIEKLGKANAVSRQAQGYTYQEERAFDVQEIMAKNAAMARPAMPTYPYGMMPGMMPPMYPYGGAPVFCPHCGNPVQAGAKFCGVCGGDISKPIDSTIRDSGHTHTYSTQAAGKTCPRCGYPLLPRNTVCPSCNYDTADDDK